MNPYTWSTDYAHVDNEQTMQEYLHEHCMLNITYVDGTYAEGYNQIGDTYAIRAMGNGDFCNHRIEFELL